MAVSAGLRSASAVSGVESSAVVTSVGCAGLLGAFATVLRARLVRALAGLGLGGPSSNSAVQSNSESRHSPLSGAGLPTLVRYINRLPSADRITIAVRSPSFN